MEPRGPGANPRRDRPRAHYAGCRRASLHFGSPPSTGFILRMSPLGSMCSSVSRWFAVPALRGASAFGEAPSGSKPASRAAFIASPGRQHRLERRSPRRVARDTELAGKSAELARRVLFRFSEVALTPAANHRLIAAILSRKRGRRPSSRTLGQVAVDAAASSRALCARTSDAEAYGEVVWS